MRGVAGGVKPIREGKRMEARDEGIRDLVEVGEDRGEVFRIPQKMIDDHQKNREPPEEIDFPDALLFLLSWSDAFFGHRGIIASKSFFASMRLES